MSNYTSQARENMQKLYGYYCNMCKDMSIERILYTNFTQDIYNSIRKQYKEWKHNSNSSK